MSETKTKKKQKPKPGHVLRVDAATWRFIEKKRRGSEPFASLMRRLIGLPNRKGEPPAADYYVLPGAHMALETIEEARGAAILLAVKGKKGKALIERPVAVRVIE